MWSIGVDREQRNNNTAFVDKNDKMATCIGETDFPPYVIKCMNDTHFLVAGGGGESKTGVPNALVS